MLRNHAAALLVLLLAACSSTPPSGSDLPAVSSRQKSWPELDETSRRQRIARLLPATVRDRNGWANDLHSAFSALQIPHEPALYCATMAIIEQESSFQTNPTIPGLGKIASREIENRASKYGIPSLLLNAALQKSSPDGRSYKQRIDALKTEKEMSDLYDEMIAEIPFGKRLLADSNPVHTGGPMQVSVTFAEQQSREKPYPYAITKSLRDEIFSRRGGLYFGIAILLDYPAPYDDIVYRFADFNAGRYSSRNAAFQSAISRLSGQPLTQDGDLLRYRQGKPSKETSSVENALIGIANRLKLSPSEIRRDLLLEKSAGFSDSRLFKQVFALGDQTSGQRLPRQMMPNIDLKSPKITRALTTEWFARRVEGRYKSCLGRIDAAST